MAKPNIDKTMAEKRMRILLELKNDLSQNACFKMAGVVEKEQRDALASLFNAIDGMIAVDARVLAFGECRLEQHQ